MATFISMATCHSCNNTSRQNCVNRDFIRALSKTQDTPRTSGKPKTPQSANRTPATPKFGTKDEPSRRTPRSESCETTASSSGSKPASVKKSSFGHLKRLLKLEDDQKAKAKSKGGLKNFLMSL
ncbi:hypothetical protein UPYG_G00333160 [Umbra pygmaea]|uniref:Uncharacterized protein n=1 Tax=Umbra pygmaea TaxID=75934 RepID=A0ABD0WH29_UMBPY